MATREKIHFETIEELLGAPVEKDGTQEIKISQIKAFDNHPFKVLDDDKMAELVESIKLNGVITPVLVRNIDNGMYEMISGHRRLHAAGLAGLTIIPAVIKDMSDDEAVIAMVDANVQREEILPSERAWSLKMKMDAMKRQGQRTDLASDQNGPRLTSSEIGEEVGMSGTQVKRYVRLTNLIPEFMQRLDDKRLQFSLAYDIAGFKPEIQQYIYEFSRDNGILIPEQIAKLKAMDKGMPMDKALVHDILAAAVREIHSAPAKLSIKDKDVDRYFPPTYTAKQKESVIMELLAQWAREREENE